MAVDFGVKRDQISRYAGIPWEQMNPMQREAATRQYNQIYDNQGNQIGAFQPYNPNAPAAGQAIGGADNVGNFMVANHPGGGVTNAPGGEGGAGGTGYGGDVYGAGLEWLDNVLDSGALDNPSEYLTNVFNDLDSGGDGVSWQPPGESNLGGDWLQQAAGQSNQFVQDNWAQQQQLLQGLSDDLTPALQNLRDMYDQGVQVSNDFNQVQSQLTQNLMNSGQAIRDEYAQTYQPMVQQMQQDAANYATPERMRAGMGEAASEAARAQDAQRESAMRNLESYGIDPSQTRHQAIDASMRAQDAATRAAAANQEAARIDDTGWTRRQDALQAGINAQGMLTDAAMLDQAAGGMNQAQLQGNLQSQQELRNNLLQQLDINQLQAQYGAAWQDVANIMIDNQLQQMGLELDRRQGMDQWDMQSSALQQDWAQHQDALGLDRDRLRLGAAGAIADDQYRRYGLGFQAAGMGQDQDQFNRTLDFNRWAREGDWENAIQRANISADAQNQSSTMDAISGIAGVGLSLIPGLRSGGHVEGQGPAIPTGRSRNTLHASGPAINAAGGGHIQGPGGPKSDAIPARLSNDEYVIPAEIVKKKGTDFFDNLVIKQQAELASKQRNMGIAPPQQITDTPRSGPGIPANPQAIPMGAR